MDERRCRQCKTPLVRRYAEQKCNWEKREFCGKRCYYASRVVNDRCVECGKPAVTKGRCDVHYRQGRIAGSGGLRERLNESQRERHKRERRELADWYLRVLYDVPKDASPAVYETLRVHAKLKRALGVGKRSRLRR